MSRARLAAGVIALSAMGFAGIVSHESFTPGAVIPVPGDRPTFGFGATFKENGEPVVMGDKITAPRAVRLAVSHIAKDESILRKCVTGPLYQAEWDTLVDFSYWYGANGTCKTSIVKHINAGEYADHCAAYLRYRTAAKKDCSIPANKCRGVWVRAQQRNADCIAAQLG